MPDARRLLYTGGRTLFREAMRFSLARFGHTVVPAASLQQALDEIESSLVEVILVDDEGFGEAVAVETVATLHVKVPGIPIGVLSASRRAVFPADAVRAGAAGYLSKDMPLAELRNALEKMIDGQMVIDPTVVRSLLGVLGPSMLPDAAANGVVHLTPVERRVLTLASDGHANKQIAASLGLSPLTVKNHLARIRARLGASDKAQAVAIALRGGLLD